MVHGLEALMEIMTMFGGLELERRDPSVDILEKKPEELWNIVEGDAEGLWKIIEKDGPKVITQFPPFHPGEKMNFGDVEESMRRRKLTKLVWAVPSKKVVEAITIFATGTRILEIGAGSGVWACLLASEGATVIATDIKKKKHTFHPIEELAAVAAVEAHPECDTLFLCWPEYTKFYAVEALRAFQGDKMVYIGESEGGCCADDAFFEEMERDWEYAMMVLPRWPCINDMVYLCKRK